MTDKPETDWQKVEQEAIALSEHLIGTCAMGYEKQLFEDASDEVKECLDHYAFECGTCGWWYDTSELSEEEHELVCVECYEEENGD